MVDVTHGRIEASCSQESMEICVGCPGQDLADLMSSDPDNEAANDLAEFFCRAFKVAGKALSENRKASHKEIDEQMGEYGSDKQDQQKLLGDLDRSQVATMAKNCAINKIERRCIYNVVIDSAERVKNHPRPKKS